MNFFPPPWMFTMASGGFGSGAFDPTGSSGSSFGVGVPGPTSVAPVAPKKKESWRDRMGWTDPRTRAILAQQILSADDLLSAVGAMASGPAIKSQYQEEQERKAREEAERAEERARDEEDRQLRRKLMEDQLRRSEETRLLGLREQRDRDQEQAKAFLERKQFGKELDEAVASKKIDKGLADLLRTRPVGEGRERLINRLYPSEDEVLRRKAAKLGLENTQSLINYRNRPKPEREVDPRLLTNDRIRTVSAQIDDLRAMEPRRSSPEHEQWQGRMRLLEQERTDLYRIQTGLQKDRLAESGAIGPSRDKVVQDLANLPAIGSVEKAAALAADWERDGIYDAVVRHLQEGKDLRTAILLARQGGP